MACWHCAAEDNCDFSAEVCLHFPGLAGLSKDPVFVFPRVVVCLQCGFAEFQVPESRLRLLAPGGPAEASSDEGAPGVI